MKIKDFYHKKGVEKGVEIFLFSKLQIVRKIRHSTILFHTCSYTKYYTLKGVEFPFVKMTNSTNIFWLKFPSKFISFFRILTHFSHPHRTASIPKHHTFIFKIYISHKCLIVGFKNIECPVIWIPSQSNRSKNYFAIAFVTNGKFTTKSLSISIILSILLAAPDGWLVPASQASTVLSDTPI